MGELDVITTLEAAAKTLHDLKRWGLLGDQVQEQSGETQASPNDEIFF